MLRIIKISSPSLSFGIFTTSCSFKPIFYLGIYFEADVRDGYNFTFSKLLPNFQVAGKWLWCFC